MLYVSDLRNARVVRWRAGSRVVEMRLHGVAPGQGSTRVPRRDEHEESHDWMVELQREESVGGAAAEEAAGVESKKLQPSPFRLMCVDI